MARSFADKLFFLAIPERVLPLCVRSRETACSPSQNNQIGAENGAGNAMRHALAGRGSVTIQQRRKPPSRPRLTRQPTRRCGTFRTNISIGSLTSAFFTSNCSSGRTVTTVRERSSVHCRFNRFYSNSLFQAPGRRTKVSDIRHSARSLWPRLQTSTVVRHSCIFSG
jgi:hypothetical protein